MNIKIFKTMNGEEMMCEVLNESENHYEVRKPMILHVQPGPQGMQAGFAPALLMSDKDVTIQKSAIMMIAEPTTEFERRYLEMTSGITLATTLQG